MCESKSMESFINEIKSKCEFLMKDFNPQSKGKSILAYQRFNEYLLRLENRLDQLLILEKEMMGFNSDKVNRPLKDVQLDFVDKIEAYFQQIYSTLSAFIMLLNHVAGDNFKKSMPINSVEKFFLWILRQNDDIQLKDSIVLLDQARKFRSHFIDHPQQHILHDWMTYSHLNGTAIIYFIRSDSKIYLPNKTLDPYDQSFKPPLSCENFYVSPDYIKVYGSVKFFTKFILEANIFIIKKQP